MAFDRGGKTGRRPHKPHHSSFYYAIIYPICAAGRAILSGENFMCTRGFDYEYEYDSALSECGRHPSDCRRYIECIPRSGSDPSSAPGVCEDPREGDDINDFKNHEGISIRWMTGSPLGAIHVDAYDGRFVRGFLDHPEAGEGVPCDDVHEAALAAAKGQLFVTRYSLLKLPYTSTVNLSHGDISACLTEYMNTSEQTLSAVKLDISMTEKGDILRSAGFMAQLLPKGNMGRFAELFRSNCSRTAL